MIGTKRTKWYKSRLFPHPLVRYPLSAPSNPRKRDRLTASIRQTTGRNFSAIDNQRKPPAPVNPVRTRKHALFVFLIVIHRQIILRRVFATVEAALLRLHIRPWLWPCDMDTLHGHKKNTSRRKVENRTTYSLLSKGR